MAPCRVAVACRVPCRARCSRMPGAMSGTFGRCSRMRHMIDYRLVVRRKRRKRHSVSSACPMSHLPRRSTVDCAGRSRTCAQTLTPRHTVPRETRSVAAATVSRDDVRSLLSTGLCADYSLLVPGSQRERSVWSHARTTVPVVGSAFDFNSIGTVTHLTHGRGGRAVPTPWSKTIIACSGSRWRFRRRLFCSKQREFATKTCPKRRVWPP